MLQFQCDYLQGCAPEILKRMQETNSRQFIGYGVDPICDSAKKKICDFIGMDDADVWFVIGGTEANQLVIDSMLEPYEGVVSTVTGHVNCHESGAIENTGHKVLTLPEHDGKMLASDLKQYLKAYYADDTWEHQVIPGMVYISQPTEYGTLYSREELIAIADVCHEYKLPLYADGARFGYGLASKANDVSAAEFARIVDAFYIGGTKVGALMGEAIVFTKHNTPSHFFTRRKMHTGLLCKGWLLGIQFDELFSNDLYMRLSRNAMDMAEYLKKSVVEKGYELFIDSPTNQQFVILTNEKMEELSQHVSFSKWQPVDEGHFAVRFCTSWATTKEQVDELLSYL